MSTPSSPVVRNTDIMLAPGETNVFGERFIASTIAPYLHAQMMCSSTRFSFKVPRILLGFIPVGTEESTIPIGSIVSVSAASAFLVRRSCSGSSWSSSGWRS